MLETLTITTMVFSSLTYGGNDVFTGWCYLNSDARSKSLLVRPTATAIVPMRRVRITSQCTVGRNCGVMCDDYSICSQMVHNLYFGKELNPARIYYLLVISLWFATTRFDGLPTRYLTRSCLSITVNFYVKVCIWLKHEIAVSYVFQA